MILGFTTSVGLEEMSIELIHQKFMAKLQLVATCKNRVDKDVCQRSSTCNSNLSQDFFLWQEKRGSSSENQSNSQACHDIHEVKIYTIYTMIYSR